jgi:RimJ/RimL family protein N-acetyltransferase
VPERLALGRHREILRMFGVDAADGQRLTRRQVQTWLDGIADCPTARVIEVEGRFLGDLWLRQVNKADRNARLGIGLYDAARLGQGIGRAAIRAVFPHAFSVMGLHRLSLRVLAYNARAIACYRACGFVEEGREREAAFVDGAWQDDVLMGCLAHEAIG